MELSDDVCCPLGGVKAEMTGSAVPPGADRAGVAMERRVRF